MDLEKELKEVQIQYDKVCHERNELKKENQKLKKQLEVLEILKDNLFEEKGTGRFKGMNVISCSLGNQHSGRDYYKVKEWLENENNNNL